MKQVRYWAVLSCLVSASPAFAAVDPALQAAVKSPAREASLTVRDAARHPAEELSFFGLRPTSNVVEISPGGGYWTEILGPYLAAHGHLTEALPGGSDPEHEAAKFRAKFASQPWFGKVSLTTLAPGQAEVAPAGSADFVLTFRNVHNWMYEGTADQAFAAFFRALKPGGVLGLEEHRGLANVPQDPKGENGYVRQDYVIALAKKAGFDLVASSEMNANPRDTKNYPKGVWTLPPTFEMGGVDHAKYAAIGEADNMVLTFRKPGG